MKKIKWIIQCSQPDVRQAKKDEFLYLADEDSRSINGYIKYTRRSLNNIDDKSINYYWNNLEDIQIIVKSKFILEFLYD